MFNQTDLETLAERQRNLQAAVLRLVRIEAAKRKVCPELALKDTREAKLLSYHQPELAELIDLYTEAGESLQDILKVLNRAKVQGER